ncbi:unnamed protein product [Cylicocyclus nassatus]|uniref:CHK kinase-like domain-containing protein n=1 Tax=Cylicocyclus nassatus TaxID=53992 RepID=A0AA36GHD3_CYLNA|nr:unnamed protein product [Cylicocyclus nassatus]
MNLYSHGSGLFGTHVTWEDVEKDMQKALDTNALFGPNKTAKSIGDNKGFLSKVILVEADWQNKDKTLPDRFVVKIVTQLAMQQFTSELSNQMNIENKFDTAKFKVNFELQQKRVHNTEVAVYKLLHEIAKERIPRAEIYCMKEFSDCNPVKGYIIMEFLGDLESVEIYENISPKALSKVLRAMAVLQAASLELKEEEKSRFTQQPFSQLYAEIFSKEVVKIMMKLLRGFASKVEDMGNEDIATDVEKLEEILPDLTDLERADQLADEMGMQRVLCHGDLWPANMLWERDGDKADMAALIDFQTAHMGCPAVDLVRLFVSCLSGKDRRQYWEALIEEFYGYLVEEVGDKQMPFMLGQLKESYYRFLPMGGFMIMHSIGPLFDALCKNPDELQKAKNLAVVTEKTESLLDDIRFHHAMNKYLKKNDIRQGHFTVAPLSLIYMSIHSIPKRP